VINFKVLGIASAFFTVLILCSFAYKKSQTINIDSLSDLTPEVALRFQGKTKYLQNGIKCDFGELNFDKVGDVFPVFCKSEASSNIFYEGKIFGKGNGGIVSYDLPEFNGVSTVATYLASVDPKTGKYIATMHQLQNLKDAGLETALYITNGKGKQIGKIRFKGEEHQEISGTVSTKILGQVVYNISDANRLGFK
jgi:hypothetical protein